MAKPNSLASRLENAGKEMEQQRGPRVRLQTVALSDEDIGGGPRGLSRGDRHAGGRARRAPTPATSPRPSRSRRSTSSRCRTRSRRAALGARDRHQRARRARRQLRRDSRSTSRTSPIHAAPAAPSASARQAGRAAAGRRPSVIAEPSAVLATADRRAGDADRVRRRAGDDVVGRRTRHRRPVPRTRHHRRRRRRPRPRPPPAAVAAVVTPVKPAEAAKPAAPRGKPWFVEICSTRTTCARCRS